ncbi:hypothetical protein KFJ24_16460 [Marinobacter sediminum]|uniref:hypothetical protein n=1 Tax=Marinobacter sediminum TaxID=256323 RepID=UPI0020309D1A|nr:hypothetical protein [Marinobacter sediminum]MCM0614082.1 hypothetical protein [Marinobacter sediminum]
MPALSTSFQFALLDSSGDSPSGEFGLPATHYKDLCRATVGDLVSTFRAVH